MRNAHAYLEAHHMPRDTVEWMALMQHHGAPTRLLDWSTSPYVAAFFALEEAVDPTATCAIWAIDAAWCREQGTTLIRNCGSDDTKLKTFILNMPTWEEHEFNQVFMKTQAARSNARRAVSTQ